VIFDPVSRWLEPGEDALIQVVTDLSDGTASSGDLCESPVDIFLDERPAAKLWLTVEVYDERTG
jgi:hypothetical protein